MSILYTSFQKNTTTNSLRRKSYGGYVFSPVALIKHTGKLHSNYFPRNAYMDVLYTTKMHTRSIKPYIKTLKRSLSLPRENGILIINLGFYPEVISVFCKIFTTIFNTNTRYLSE